MGKNEKLIYPGGMTRDEFVKACDRAIKKGVREALLMHKRAGNPVAIWRDGKVVVIPPEEIPYDVAEGDEDNSPG